MHSAAFTLVQNDMVILELWLKYYSKYFDDLYVIGIGTKDEYGELQTLRKKYNFEFERVNYAGNSDYTLPLCKDKQKKLLENHDWVLYSDCDEFIVADPTKYKDLKDFVEKCDKDKVPCEGFNILHVEGESPIDFSQPYLSQRKYWAKDMDYNKCLLSKVPLNWNVGCHKEMDVDDSVSKAYANTGLFLLHLKYADLNPRSNRDFGPTITGIFHAKIEEGMKIKQEIPEKIRRLF